MSLTKRALDKREQELDQLDNDNLVAFWNIQTMAGEKFNIKEAKLDLLAMQTLLTERGIPFENGKEITMISVGIIRADGVCTRNEERTGF